MARTLGNWQKLETLKKKGIGVKKNKQNNTNNKVKFEREKKIKSSACLQTVSKINEFLRDIRYVLW